MNILFTTGGDCKYGSPKSLQQMVEELKRIDSQIQIHIVLRKENKWAQYLQNLGCNVYIVPYFPFCDVFPRAKWKYPIKYVLYGARYLWGRIFALHKLERKLELSTIDLIHSNSSKDDFGAMLANKYQKPLVWHIREFGDLDFRYYSYRQNYIEYMNKSAAEFIMISQAVQRHWIKKGLDANKCIQIYNGVKQNDYVKERYPKQGDEIKLVMLGSLSATKGQHHLIKAIALLEDEVREKIRCDIVGDGGKPYTRLLQQLVDANKLTYQVRLLGYQTDFYPHLKEYDCGVMCSKSEGFGRVTVEYMMAGLPVIASNTGANTEIVTDDFNGLVYKYGDNGNLAEKISYLVRNPHIIEKLGRNAYADALDRYSAKINAANVLREYKKILKSGDMDLC